MFTFGKRSTQLIQTKSTHYASKHNTPTAYVNILLAVFVNVSLLIKKLEIFFKREQSVVY